MLNIEDGIVRFPLAMGTFMLPFLQEVLFDLAAEKFSVVILDTRRLHNEW